MNVVIVTWQAGGGAQPAIGLGRLLAERRHRARILAPAAYGPRVTAAGCLQRSFPPALEFDPGLGRRMEDQPGFMRELFFGPALAEALAAELCAEPADVVVVDYLLRSVVCRAEQLQATTVLLVHTTHRFHSDASEDESSRRRWYAPVDAVRAELGLASLPAGADSVTTALIRRAAGALVVMPREYDDWPDPPPTVVHVGPITEEAGTPGWDSPWAPDDHRPLVVVTLGTTYMAQEGVLRRIAEALEAIDARVLILTGAELAPEDVELPPGVHVRAYLPHSAVIPGAALVVTHAGTGTLMAAFSAGVPVVCLPLGRDQGGNAQRVEELGLGSVLSATAKPAEIRQAIAAALAAPALSERALRMAAAVGAYGAGERAVAVLERLGGSPAERRPTG